MTLRPDIAISNLIAYPEAGHDGVFYVYDSCGTGRKLPMFTYDATLGWKLNVHAVAGGSDMYLGENACDDDDSPAPAGDDDDSPSPAGDDDDSPLKLKVDLPTRSSYFDNGSLPRMGTFTINSNQFIENSTFLIITEKIDHFDATIGFNFIDFDTDY